MKLKNAFLIAIAVIAFSCSNDDSATTTPIKKTGASKTITNVSSTSNKYYSFQEYRKLLESLYGVGAFGTNPALTYVKDGQSFVVSKVVKLESKVSLGYLIEEKATSKTYYITDNATTGVVTKYSTQVTDEYVSESFNVSNDPFYLKNGLNPDEAFKIPSSERRRFFGYSTEYEDCINGTQVEYQQLYIFGIAVNDHVYTFDEAGEPRTRPC